MTSVHAFKTSVCNWTTEINLVIWVELILFFYCYHQWHWDVNQKVMLTNEKPIPVLLLANKVRNIFYIIFIFYLKNVHLFIY